MLDPRQATEIATVFKRFLTEIKLLPQSARYSAQNPQKDATMTDIDKRRKQLLGRLAELDDRLTRIEDELDDAPNPDWEDSAVESEGDEVLEQLGTSGQDEQRAIEAALKRIEAGTYGECVKCGAEISEERLDALPHTPFCRECAKAV